MPSTAFGYTGSTQSFVVPAGVTTVRATLIGGGGGGVIPGAGARVIADLTVTPGETLTIYVGDDPSSIAGGWPDGGNGSTGSNATTGGGGGGSSSVRRASTVLAIAGGGGGSGSSSIGSYPPGGAAGVVGGNGAAGGSAAGVAGGGGGTQSAGGSGSAGATSGSSLNGGNGASAARPGGGGGGGYYGGGGGGGTAITTQSGAAGGGGSSAVPVGTHVSSTAGVGTGSGSVVIDWTAPSWTGTITAAPALSAVAVTAYARSGTVTAAPALSASAVSAMIRTGNLASAPALSAVAFVDDGSRSGTITASPVLTAVAVARLTRTADLTAAPVLTATQANQISPQRTGTVTAAATATATALISKETRTALLTVAPELSGPGIPDITIPPGPPVVGQVDLRVRAYAPNGASQGILPAPTSTRCALPLNDVGALTLTYGVTVPRADLLGQPCELAIEVTQDGGNTWEEPPDGRFLYLQDGRDPASLADEYAAEAKGYVWRLTKARVLAEGSLNGEGRREFSGIGPGTLFGTLWAEAQARGSLAGMTLEGGGLTDAVGTPFYVPVSRSYDVGQDLLSVLMDLEVAGYLDFRMEGRTLRLFVKDMALAADRTITPDQVTITPLQVTEAPFRRTWEGLADSITVMGDEGATVTISNPGALRPWGRWEDFITAGGVSDAGTLTTVGQRYQTLTEDVRQEVTHGLALGIGQTPLVDFWVGDYIWSQPNAGAKARYRVRQVTLEKEGGTVRGNVVLNDRFLEGDIRTRRAIDSMTSGASLGGSTGPLPTPPGPDILQPAAVTSLLGSSSVYVDASGTTWGQVSLDWPDVTTNLDGTPLTDLDHYEVQVRSGDSSSTLQWQRQPDTTQSRASYSPYVPGSLWSYRVRAVDTSGNWGPWSPLLTVTISADTIGPVKPTTPTATSRLGNGAITWDGLAFGGLPMDADFDHGDIHLSTVSGFSWSAANRFTAIGGAETVQVGPLTMDATYYGRLVPYDTSGNAGTPSDQFSFVVKALVDVTNFPDSAMATLYARTAHFITLDADQVSANAAAIGFLETGTIQGGIFETTAGGEFRTAANPAASGGVRIRGTDGFKAYGNQGGGPVVQTVSIDPVTGLISAVGTIATGTPTSARVTMETSGGAGVLSVYDASTLIGQIRASSFLGSPAMLMGASGGGTLWLGNGTATLIGASGVFLQGAVTASADFSLSVLPTTVSPPNLRRGADDRIYENPNMSLGANDSGGAGFRLVRVPN